MPKNAKKWQKGEKAINPDFIFGNFSRRGGSIGIKPGQKVGPKIYSFLKKFARIKLLFFIPLLHETE